MPLLLRREQPISKEQLEQLYCDKQFSMAEIAQALDCSINKVVYWMERYQIPRRHREEANYIKHNPDGDPFKIKSLETDDDRELFQLAIGLYIGEGTKGTKGNQRVRLANTNPQVIRAFLRFLRETCGVEEEKIFAWINIFDDVNLEEAQIYWEQVTGLPRSQFHKPMVRSSHGGNYKNKSKYGTLTVGINNSKLMGQISNWCKSTLQKFGS